MNTKRFLLLLLLTFAFVSPTYATDPEIAAGKSITATTEAGATWSASKANDNNNTTYWESQQHVFPQSITVDLTARHYVTQIVLKEKSSWGARTQNIEVLFSDDNSTFTSTVAAADYSMGTATINLSSPTGRYVRLKINSNSLSPTAQLADFEVYGTPVPIHRWDIQSVDAMKATKDKVCTSAQLTNAQIEDWVERAVEVGATHIAISQPYDNPACGDAVAYTERWIAETRDQGLSVWHRHMPLAFEGIYSTTKKNDDHYLEMVATYIKDHATQFEAGDIFTPIPEPQNGGITNVSYCAQNVCQFSSAKDFNNWLKTAMYVTEEAFEDIGLEGQVEIGYFGFDGFITWGDNNPDWQGKGFLTQSAVERMGVLAIDHYPNIGASMSGDLAELRVKWPSTPLVIGEWGTITATNSAQQVIQLQDTYSVFAAQDNMIGVNYWQFGNGPSNESLINTDFSIRDAFNTLKSFFIP